MTAIRDVIAHVITNAVHACQQEGIFPTFDVPRVLLTHPDHLEHGDYATNIALQLAKQVGKPPREVAEAIVKAAERQLATGNLPDGVSYEPGARSQELIARFAIAGPGYINLFLSDAWLAEQATEAARHPKTFHRSDAGKGKTVIVELSSPNIAKEMGIGHLRSTIIGDALARMYEALGYRVVRDNHLGDWGTQFGKMIVAVRRSGGEQRRDWILADLLALYVQFHKDVEAHPELEDAARVETKKLQDGDPANTRLWKRFIAITLKDFRTIYRRLGVRFDTMHGESFYQPMLAAVVADAKASGVARESEGALIVPFDDLPPFLILKSDGASNYGTTDLATIRYRDEAYHPERILYIVANQQALHFEQLFRAAAMLGWGKPETLTHVKFGMVLGSDGKKFATREGKTVLLNEVMNEAVRRAGVILEKSDLPESERAAVAEIVGIGALKYFDLAQHRLQDIRFDWDRMLSLTGNSAPYLQYVAVRIEGILRKAGKGTGGRGAALPWTPEEQTLYRLLYRFPEVLADATERNEPHHIAEYLFTLAQRFHGFYDRVPVTKAEGATRAARIRLIRAVRAVIVGGLDVLGIKVPKRM